MHGFPAAVQSALPHSHHHCHHYCCHITHLSLCVWNAERTLINTAQQGRQSTAVTGNRLWGGLQLLHTLHAAIQQGS